MQPTALKTSCQTNAGSCKFAIFRVNFRKREPHVAEILQAIRRKLEITAAEVTGQKQPKRRGRMRHVAESGATGWRAEDQ